jgi:hypothetical protein
MGGIGFLALGFYVMLRKNPSYIYDFVASQTERMFWLLLLVYLVSLLLKLQSSLDKDRKESKEALEIERMTK